MDGFVEFAYEKANTNYNYAWRLEQNVYALTEWATLLGQDILESNNIIFNTGILQKTKHSMNAYFIINKREIIVKLRLGTPTPHGKFTQSKISDKRITLNLGPSNSGYLYFTKITKEDLEETSLKTIFDEPGTTETIWRHKIDHLDMYQFSVMNICFTLEHIFWGEGTIDTKCMGNQLALPNESTTWITLNTKNLYHSEEWTDFVISCGDSNFKVHKIVLAIRSPVLAAMFKQPLAEALEGKMTISDYEPLVIQEFLKFLYTGNADFENCASELFLLGEKYCVDHLKRLSEIHLLNSVSVDNALDLFNLGELANSEKLTNKCLDTMKRHKKEMFKTPDDLVAFFRNYPNAFEVFLE